MLQRHVKYAAGEGEPVRYDLLQVTVVDSSNSCCAAVLFMPTFVSHTHTQRYTAVVPQSGRVSHTHKRRTTRSTVACSWARTEVDQIGSFHFELCTALVCEVSTGTSKYSTSMICRPTKNTLFSPVVGTAYSRPAGVYAN